MAMRLSREFEQEIRATAQKYVDDPARRDGNPVRGAFEDGAYWALRVFTERMVTERWDTRPPETI